MVTDLFHLYSTNDSNGRRVCVSVTNNDDGKAKAKLKYDICGHVFKREIDLDAGETKYDVCVDHDQHGGCAVMVVDEVSGKRERRLLDLDAGRSP